MKKVNDGESKEAIAKKLIARIIKDSEMQDIYDFVNKKMWEDVGFSSFQECIDENEGFPSYSTMRRNYKAVVFQKTYLPKTEVGDIKESVLRPIHEGKHSEKIKKEVAAKIIKSGIEPHNLEKKNIEEFIKQSKIVLNKRHKDAASEFAGLMADECVDEIQKYVEQNKMRPKKSEAFLNYIGSKVKAELKDLVA